MKKILFSVMLCSSLFGVDLDKCIDIKDKYWSMFDRMMAAIDLSDYDEALYSKKKLQYIYYDSQQHCPEKLKKLYTKSFNIIQETFSSVK